MILITREKYFIYNFLDLGGCWVGWKMSEPHWLTYFSYI